MAAAIKKSKDWGVYRIFLGLCAVLLVATIRIAEATDQLEITAVIDGIDQIVISQESASWNHISGTLTGVHATMNGVAWNPSASLTLLNIGATAFLTNKVDFMSARIQSKTGRGTIVLEREADRLVLSFADTPGGAGDYHVVIEFPEVPTLSIRAIIDGSDELHISYAGARWLHKQFREVDTVSLNGVSWNPAANRFLTNSGATTFLPEPVHFENAVVRSRAGRELITVRPSDEGLIINFADQLSGAGLYEAVIAFPPGEEALNASIATSTFATLRLAETSAITAQTVRGVWYELQSALNLSANVWESTGSFIRGNGEVMTMFDGRASSEVKFYRVVSRISPGE